MRRAVLRWPAAGWLVTAALAVALAVTLAAGVSPAAALSPQPAPQTTLAPIKAKVPPPLSTVPLITRAQNAHVDPLLAYLSGVGFFVALVIMGTQYVLTRPGRRGRRTL